MAAAGAGTVAAAAVPLRALWPPLALALIPRDCPPRRWLGLSPWPLVLLLRLLLLARIHFGQLRRGRLSSLIFPILHRLLLLLPCLFLFAGKTG